MKLLNKLEEISDTYLTIEIKGNQWYWKYIYKDLKINYESYTKINPDYSDLRLLTVDKPLYIPVNIPIRYIITSEDVIHSFTLPHLGIKIDANPGKINTVILNILKQGLYYGQCSELCGILHNSMSIELRCISHIDFLLWILTEYDINKKLYSILSRI